jgi:uncharacterized protein
VKEMRRQDRSITEIEAFEILSGGEYGFLSTVSADGVPYGVPVNFCMIKNTVYIHCATEGEKLDNIRNNQKVCFTVVGKTELLPDSFSTLYESAIIRGRAEEIGGSEKLAALETLVEKYSADYIINGEKYIKAMKEKTVVIAIRIDSLSGKARKK